MLKRMTTSAVLVAMWLMWPTSMEARGWGSSPPPLSPEIRDAHTVPSAAMKDPALHSPMMACNECISQVLGGVSEHWFGNTPDDTKYDGSHSNPEGGSCSDYHDACDEEEEDVQEALALHEAGELSLERLLDLSRSAGGKMISDAVTGDIFIFGCSWQLTAQFRVPKQWARTVREQQLSTASQ